MARQRSILMTLSALVVATAASVADAKVLIAVDKATQSMTVSVDGVHRWTWPVSTGVRAYNTPNGRHQAFRMERDHFSKEWDDAPMPHSIFFTKRGHAIHGYLNTKRIGQPASHGCVRLEPQNAAKLFALVQREGVLNTTVVIAGSLPTAAPAIARRPTAPTYSQQPRSIDPRAAQPYDPRYGHRQYGQPPSGQRYDPRYVDPRYADQRYRDPRYADPRYGDPRYADPRYAEDNYPPPPQRRRFLFFNVD